MAAEINKFGNVPRLEFTSPSSQLAIATLKYKNEIRQNHLTPDTITNYWRTLYKAYAPKSEIEISHPLLIGKNSPQEFRTEIKKLDPEVSRFPGTIEEVKEYSKLGMEPVYVSGQLLGRHGIEFLKNMYSGEIKIPNLPKIENKNTKGGWRYAQVKAEFLNVPEAEPMDFPTYATMAASMKQIYDFWPDVQKLEDTQKAKDINTSILEKNNTMSILNGSIIGYQFAEYNSKPKETGFNFNPSGQMFTTTLEGDTESLNLINRLQIPIF